MLPILLLKNIRADKFFSTTNGLTTVLSFQIKSGASLSILLFFNNGGYP